MRKAGAGGGALPVTAAAQEPHDLPGGLILPFCEQTTSVGYQGERHEGLAPWNTRHLCGGFHIGLPQFVLHQGSSSPPVVGFEPAELLVAAVVLLDEHSGPPALLELLLFVVAAKFTLDKDGGLRHLLIKCILSTRA